MSVRDYLLDNCNDIIDLPVLVISDIGIFRYFESIDKYLNQRDFIECFDYAGASVQLDINGEDSFVLLYTKSNF